MAFGRLDPGDGPQPMSEINVTPLVDVMLVLLVVFIITAPLLTQHVPLTLPDAKSQPAATLKTTVVSITAAGQVFMDDQPVKDSDLPVRLSALASRPDPNVELRADKSVIYERVVQVLTQVQAAGISRVAFVTQPLIKK